MKSSQPEYSFDQQRIGFIPQKHRNAKVGDLDTQAKKDLFYRAMEGQSFLFHGKAGTGKSYLGFLISKYMTGKYKDEQGLCSCLRGVAYISFPMMMNDVRSASSTFNRDKVNKELKEAGNASFLMIDEFNPDSNGLKGELYDRTFVLISEREMAGRQTIFTANLSLKEIDQLTDNRISSRIAGMCKNNGIVEFSGEDRRWTRKDGKK